MGINPTARFFAHYSFSNPTLRRSTLSSPSFVDSTNFESNAVENASRYSAVARIDLPSLYFPTQLQAQRAVAPPRAILPVIEQRHARQRPNSARDGVIPDVGGDEPRRGAAQPALREGILLVHALVLHVEEDSARFLRHGDDARAGDVADEMARRFLAGEIADVLESRGKQAATIICALLCRRITSR